MSFVFQVQRCVRLGIGLYKALCPLVDHIAVCPPMALFEWHWITWTDLEDNKEERLWDSWAKPKEFQSLPPAQETRHRLNDKVLWMGNGTSSWKFTLVDHENLQHKPSWRMPSVLTSHAKEVYIHEYA